MSSACVDYVPALCTHRPSLLPIEWLSETSGLGLGGRKAAGLWKVVQTWSFRGSKSRNKVSVGEPAEGSLTNHALVLGPRTFTQALRKWGPCGSGCVLCSMLCIYAHTHTQNIDACMFDCIIGNKMDNF